MGKIDDTRATKCPTSASLYTRAQRVFPSGVTHDSRHHLPFPLYVTHAKGSRKWDVDGNEYVDYRMGHGALILGHGHAAIEAALVEQSREGTHYGACHELEIRWAELICQIVPCAERVKFVSSGTEATMMAMRQARAVTGKNKILKIQGGFHGWHDYAVVAMQPPYDVPISMGVPEAVAGTVLAGPPHDATAIERMLDEDGDIAAVILIAGGAGREYLQAVRDATRKRGVLLIFDEVVTGFRYAPGGCQEYYGLGKGGAGWSREMPDLVTLAKILAGGLPGACVAGRADLFERFEIRDDDAEWSRFGRIAHPGTYNANPLSAAAGVACLEIVRDPEIQRTATATADTLREGIDSALERHGVEGSAGGEVSMINVSVKSPKAPGRSFQHAFRSAVQLGGIDFSGSLIVSAVHDARDVARTLEAFDSALTLLKGDGYL